VADGERAGLPVRAALHPTGLYFVLRQIGSEALQDAFLQQTVARVTAPETVVHIPKSEVGKVAPGTAPAGLIFHVARCGSTLLSQMLKQQGAVVYAEPLAVNEILSPPHKWPRAELIAALRSLGALFAAHAGGPYVLKFSSWNTLYCDILAEAFPQTPWVFSYRDPVEVGVSLLSEPPGWFADASETSRALVKAADPAGAAASQDEFVARLYGALCDAGARLDPARGRLVPYEALPAAVWDSVVPHFSLALDAAQKQRMAAAAGTYSKAPLGKAAAFAPDSVKKRAGASPALLEAVNAFARPALARLVARFAP
jgi:hypothetical protein